MALSNSEERAKKIKELVQEMKLYNNPEEIELVRKEIRKNVPLSMRGYLTAYLFIKSNPTSSATKKTTARPETKDAVSFYINVGKMSKTSAKDLAEFICKTAEIESKDIASIAFKQNYSFVYIKKEKSGKIIEKVNGASYNGRKIKINYSKESNEN